MINKVKTYILQNNMLAAGDAIVVGVSGGADSVCLLFTLFSLQKELSIRITAVHVNHGIRQTALRDEQYVTELSEKLGIPLIKKQIFANDLAVQSKTSVEEAGRNARYDIFEETRKLLKGKYNLEDRQVKIAVAHNSNDNAETMLFQLFRGSNLRGLGGIRPVRGNIIRPLLCVERREIVSFLQERDILWMEDETNLETTYTRNLIRHEILPHIVSDISSNAINRLFETAEELQATEEFLSMLTQDALQECVTVHKDMMQISAERYGRLSGVIQKRVLYRCMEDMAGKAKDLTRAQVLVFADVFNMQVGKKVSLPYNLRAVRTYIGVDLIRQDILKEAATSSTIQVSSGNLLIPGEYIDINGIKWSFLLRESEKVNEIEQKKYTKWIDYDKITKYLEVRTRRTGDYLFVGSHGERKKLKDYFINEKIPAQQRDELPLLADGDEIVWIPGYRLNARYKVSEHTKTILEIHIGGEENV